MCFLVKLCFGYTVDVALFVLEVFYRSLKELVKVGLLSVAVGKAHLIWNHSGASSSLLGLYLGGLSRLGGGNGAVGKGHVIVLPPT
jgi:hypothetical protein